MYKTLKSQLKTDDSPVTISDSNWVATVPVTVDALVQMSSVGTEVS